MKKLIFIFLSLIFTLTARAVDLYEVTATRLNVRVAPTTTGRVIGAVVKGDLVEVLEARDSGWAAIEFNNRIGFVSTRYLKFVGNLDEAPKEEEEEKIEEPVPVVAPVKAKPETVTREFDGDFPTVLTGPCSISNNFDLYYGASVSLGGSTFIWDGKRANGTLSYSLSLFAQLNFKNRVAFLPQNYLTEFHFGYNHQGAAWYPMDYVHVKLYPFGYRYSIAPVDLVAKLGANLAFPLSELKAHNSSQTWSAAFQAALAFSIGAEYKQYGAYLNIDYGFTPVASGTPVGLHNANISLSFSYKLGQLKHFND